MKLDAEDMDQVWRMVDAVEEAFYAEGKSLSGKELIGRSKTVNARLRHAWRIVIRALPERAA